MHRIPCDIQRWNRDDLTVTLRRADLPQIISLVDQIKDGSYKGVELVGKDGKVCVIRCEGGLLTFVIGDVTLPLDENQDEVFRSFLTDMTADVPRYDHIDLEFRDRGIDLAVRVER